jgi:alanine racemase
VRVEPVVKADAYGHGAVPVASALQAAGADGLSVATFDEAVELRDAGIVLPILVLYPVPPAHAPDAARLNLALTAGDPILLDRTIAALAAVETDLPVLRLHVEVETGLGRGGFDGPGAVTAARSMIEAPGVELAGLWSHLGSADDPARSASQVGRFGSVSEALLNAGVALPARHLAASGGLLAGSSPPFEAIRPGLATYGIVPEGLPIDPVQGSTADALRPVMSLRARPVRVAEVAAGSTISYGTRFVASRPTRVATLPVGYGDGFARAFTNRAAALVRGMRVPLVGTVAMDAVMADVTDVPGPPVSVDDEFVLLGEQGDELISAHELATYGNTISYETVTAMSRRLSRVYDAAAEAVGLRTLTAGRIGWHTSNSGAGISATSRSTRS